MSNDDIVGELVRITTQLENLEVVSSESAQRLRTDKAKVEKLQKNIKQGQSELSAIQRRIQALRDERNRVIFWNESPSVRDKVGRTIDEGATVMIANHYTKFSTQFPTIKAIKKPQRRGARVR